MARHLGGILAVAMAVLGVLGVTSTVLADDDTTPPAGTLVIDGGRGYTADGVLDLDVTATDDVAVTTVRIGLLGEPPTDFPYAPHITYSIGDVSTISQQQLTLVVEWLDAAGNHSSAKKTFWLDWAAPVLKSFHTTDDQGPAGTVTFTFGVLEEGSGVAAVRLSTNGGSTWGAEVPMTNQGVVWDPRDTSLGGKATGVGEVPVSAKVRDGSGQWSNVRSTTITMEVALSIKVSVNPTTGQPVTLSPDWAAPVSLPKGAMCLWEFMWGDNQSIYNGNRDQTFGYLATQGPASKGFCGPWTFTLPWTPVRHYLVSLRVMQSDWTSLGEHVIGASPSDPSFDSAVGSTNRRITSSNLPMFYVLPDSYELHVGEAAVYHGYALGGATIKSSDKWVIEYVNTPEMHSGSSTLTFFPKRTGNITVCLEREYSAGTQISACFDPPVKAGSSSGGSGGSGGSGTGSATAQPSSATAKEASLPPPTAVPSSPEDAGESSVATVAPGDVAVIASSAAPSAAGGEGAIVPGQAASAAPPAWIAIGVLGLAFVLAGLFAGTRPGARLRLREALRSVLPISRRS